MEIKICQAESRDIAGIAEILRDLGWFTRMSAETPVETQAHIASQLDLCQADGSHSVFVSRAEDETILGYVSIHWIPYLIHTGPEGYISELFIHSRARGQGIGSRLLETAEVEGRRRGCTRLALLNMRQRESYQREFYSRHGWVERPDAANFLKYLGEH